MTPGEGEGNVVVPQLPRVSVIIPVHADQAGVDACLAALADQDFPGAETEVIVVDDASPSPIVVRGYPNVRVLRVARGGSYVARNAGVAASRGSVLAFTDADTIPAPSWLSSAMRRLTREPDAVIAGHVEVTTRQRPSGAELVDLVHGFPQAFYAKVRNFGVTANLIMTREHWDSVGGFDEQLRSGGDQEWGWRARRAGIEVRYAAEVCVAHPARRSLRERWRKHRRTLAALAELRRRGVRNEGDDILALCRPDVHHYRRMRHDPALAARRAWLRYVGAHLANQLMMVALALRHHRLDFLGGRIRTWRPNPGG